MSCLANQNIGQCPHADFYFNLIKYKLDSLVLHDERADPANAVHRQRATCWTNAVGFDVP